MDYFLKRSIGQNFYWFLGGDAAPRGDNSKCTYRKSWKGIVLLQNRSILDTGHGGGSGGFVEKVTEIHTKIVVWFFRFFFLLFAHFSFVDFDYKIVG